MARLGLVNEVLKRAKTVGVATFKTNWLKGGYINSGGGFQQWEPRIHAYDHPILLDTRASFNSLQAAISGGQIKFSISTPYIGYHQTGYYAGSTYVPPRPTLYHNDIIHKGVLRSIQEVVYQNVRNSTGTKPNMQR